MNKRLTNEYVGSNGPPPIRTDSIGANAMLSSRNWKIAWRMCTMIDDAFVSDLDVRERHISRVRSVSMDIYIYLSIYLSIDLSIYIDR